MTRAGLYARISKDRLADGLGVERQQKDLRKLCTDRGWTVAEVYVDNDLSASDPRIVRPSFERMLSDVASGRLDVVAAWDDDRLVRQPAELERFFGILDDAGASYATLSNTVDVATGDGVLVARVKGAVAAEEVRKLSQRSRAKHTELAERGRPSGGGHRAYGYACSKGRRIVLGEAECDLPECAHDGVATLEAEAEFVREAARRYIAGEGFRPIARWLNAEGACTSTGREWTDATLRNVLVNPRYVGLRTHKGEVVGPAVWAPILDRATHERIVQLTSTRRRPGPKAPQKHLLSGLLRCGLCGAKMYAAPVAKRTGYRCHKRPGLANCGRISISADPVNDLVAEMVLYRLDSPAVDDAATSNDTADERDLIAEVARLEHKLAEVAEMFGEGEITRAQLRDLNGKLRPKLESAQSALAADDDAARRADVSDRADVIRTQWADLPFEQRYAIVATLIETVEISPADKRGSKTVDAASRVTVNWSA